MFHHHFKINKLRVFTSHPQHYKSYHYLYRSCPSICSKIIRMIYHQIHPIQRASELHFLAALLSTSRGAGPSQVSQPELPEAPSSPQEQYKRRLATVSERPRLECTETDLRRFSGEPRGGRPWHSQPNDCLFSVKVKCHISKPTEHTNLFPKDSSAYLIDQFHPWGRSRTLHLHAVALGTWRRYNAVVRAKQRRNQDDSDCNASRRIKLNHRDSLTGRP